MNQRPATKGAMVVVSLVAIPPPLYLAFWHVLSRRQITCMFSEKTCFAKAPASKVCYLHSGTLECTSVNSTYLASTV